MASAAAAGDHASDADAVAASGPRGPAPAVTPGGISPNKNTAPANAAAQQIPRSSPADGTVARQNLHDFALGAGPRLAPPLPPLKSLPQLQAPQPRAAALVRDSADSARGDAPCPARWLDTVDWHSDTASAGPLAGKLGCNSGTAAATAGTVVHSLSKDNVGGETDARALDRPGTRRDTEVGPREVCSRRSSLGAELLSPLRDVFMGTSKCPQHSKGNGLHPEVANAPTGRDHEMAGWYLWPRQSGTLTGRH